MENASKALIIAGAILLAIVIISLGLVVVNNTRETVNNANISEQEIQTFNAKFTSYESSTGISAAKVKALIQAVMANNNANTGNTDKTVQVSYGTTTNKTADADLSTISSSITNSKQYKVTLGYAKGLVHTITIADKT